MHPTNKMKSQTDAGRAEELLQLQALKKGYAIVYLREFIIERFGQLRWDDFVSGLPRADKDVLSSVVKTGWYPLSFHARLNRAACGHFRPGSFTIAQEIGRFSAQQDMRSLHQWCVHLMRPSFIIRNMSAYWRRGDDTGSWTTTIYEDEIVARLADWGVVEPALCQRLLGYLGGLLEFRGPVTLLAHTQCRARGAPFCEFRCRWSLDTDTPLRGRLFSREDIPAIERELSHCSDLDALEDAIVDFFRVNVSCPQVHLWVRPVKGGDLMLARSAGERRTEIMRCFVIETSSRVIGRLELELPQSATAAQAAELVDSLLSSIALLLDARLSQSGADPGDLKRRVASATDLWRLTTREAQVLELAVLGLDYKDIGEELGCEECTVEVHMSRIRSKCSPDRPITRVKLIVKFWTELVAD